MPDNIQTTSDNQLEQEARCLETAADPMIERLETVLHGISAETPVASMPLRLRPLWEALSSEDENVATLFIEKNVRKYFQLTVKDILPLLKAFRQIRSNLLKRVEAQEKANQQTALLERDTNSSEVLNAIAKIGIADPAVLDLVIATYISARLGTIPPIWLMLVGVPSSFKTEMVRLIDLPEVFCLDTLSENAFVSGYVKEDGSEPEDLLPLLNRKCFVVKDLTTIFSLKGDTVKKILGDLTSIFDGQYSKFTATRGEVRYSSRFSMIGCVTPAILNKHHQYMHQLGGRFFFVRIPELTPKNLERGYEIAWDSSDREARITEARQIVSSYCYQLSEKALATFNQVKTEDPSIQQWMNTAAEFMARARGTTMTRNASFENKKGDKVDYWEVSDPQIEQPWRILNQLRSLSRVLAAMRGKAEVGIAELESLKPIILSSMPIDRAAVVDQLLKADHLSSRDIAECIDKSPKTAGRDLKELESLGLVDTDEAENEGIKYKVCSLKAKYKAFLTSVHNSDIPF